MAERKKILNVVVVGGSLGGLFSAIVLKRLGHNVRIFERTPSALLHHQGAGIVFQGPAQDFFKKYDRTKTSLAIVSKERQYIDKESNVTERTEYEQKMTSWDLVYNVLRRNFDGAGEDGYFKNSAFTKVADSEETDGKGEYLYGHKVTSIKDIGSGGVEVGFEDMDGTKESLKADLIIGADGPSSTVREMMLPQVHRMYAGYVAWRGTVLESEVDTETRELLTDRFTFFQSEGLQILVYLIPGENGTINPGQRLFNYVWYCNYDANSKAHKKLMTDSTGTYHHYTLPAGKISPEVWSAQKETARSVLPPPFSELVQKTQTPFVQVITDVLSPQHVFMGGKFLLVGDALAGFRPHTAASTSQAATDALLLDELMRGNLQLKEWERHTGNLARDMSRRGIEMGNRSQFSKSHVHIDQGNF